MSGVNEYFNGRYVSKDAKSIVWLMVVVTLAFISGTYITYFSAYGEEEPSPVRIQSRFVFGAYANSLVTRGIILIEGLLERNIIQIVLSSVFNLITFGLLVADIVVYMEFDVEYIYLGLSVANIAFNLYSFWWVNTLRKEFGWFYYKSYGSSWESSNVCTLRKTQSVLMRLIIQDILCFWLFREIIYNVTTLHYAATALFYCLVVLYIIEGTFESYLLRAINIIISALLLAHAIFLIPWSIVTPELGANEGPYLSVSLAFIGTTSIRTVLLLAYTTVLILDLYSFGKGYRGYYKVRQRQRMRL